MRTTQSKNIAPTSFNHSPFQKESSNNFFGNSKNPFFKVSSIQTKLTANQPGDIYEKEADAMADKVVQRLSEPASIQTKPFSSIGAVTPFVQRKCVHCEEEEKLHKKEKEEDKDLLKDKLQKKPIFESNAKPLDDPLSFGEGRSEILQRKCAECEKEEKLQKKPDGSPHAASSNIESSLNYSKGSGSSLPTATCEQMENSFGTDFSNVRIHNNSSAVQMSKDLNAQAFTHGSDIYFNTEKYKTDSFEGKHLLAHELTHVIQQTNDASWTIQRTPASDLDDSYKKTLGDKNWQKAAEYLNGFNKEDILARLNGMNTGIEAAIYAGALGNPAVGPNSQVADLTRWAYLEMNFKNELTKQQWTEAAKFLNGFNNDDIKKYLGTLDINVKVNLRNAAIPGGYPAVVKSIDNDIPFQTFEKARIAKLEDDYNLAIANKDWKNAAILLNGYNDEDIQLKLSLLNITSPESVKLIRSAADNMDENSRVGKFAGAIVMGSGKDIKSLLLAGPFIGDVWTMQFIKGIEISGLGARFGESWDKVKQNLSDPKNGAKFIGGIYVGYPVGVAKDIVDNVVGILELAWDLIKLNVEATFEPDKLADEITKIVKALPALILQLMNGEEMGYQMGLYLSRNVNKEFIQKGSFDQGELIGEIIGRITTEIALLFVGVEEVSAVAKSLKATKWGVAVAEALEGSKIGKALLEAKGAGKVLKGVEEVTLDAEKMENALAKMARIEEKAPNITEDMMKLEERVMADRVSKGSELVKPLKEAGFDAEIKIEQHTYKRVEVEGTWCRFSPIPPKCNIHLPEDVEKAVDNKVPSKVRLAYAGQKKFASVSGDVFEEARAFRKGLGMDEEALKKNIAVAKVVTDDKEVIFLKAANQGAGGAHSEEMIAGQLNDLNNQFNKLGKKGRVVELFSERVPCSNCREVIKNFFGEIDVFYMLSNSEPERWKVLRNRWLSIEKALATTKK